MHTTPLTATDIKNREREICDKVSAIQEKLIAPFVKNAEKFSPSGKLLVPQKCQQAQKGGAPKPPKTIAPPPPVRESNRQVAAEGETERMAAAKRKGLASTVNPGSLLGNYDQPGTRSLL